MKKIYYLFIAITISSMAFAQLGQIPNGGFENWSMSTLYDYPTQWGNSNSEEWNGSPTVIKSTDAAAGTFSCEISSLTTGPSNDTITGYVYHGTVGQGGPDGGITYSTLFDEVRYQFKSDLAVGDTAYLIMMRFVSSVMVEMVSLPAASGTNSTWTQGSINVTSTPQDELFIGFVVGDVINGISPSPGSWFRVDDVQLHNTGSAVTALPDPSFEQWSTQTVETPDNWFTMNEMLSGQGLNNANKTTDANSGSFAIEMTTQQNFNGDTIPAFISWGPIDFFAMGNPFLPAPYNATPTTFSGSYKYAPANGDMSAGIQIIFFQSGVQIGVHTEPFSASAGYTSFSSPLTIVGTPDSIVFAAFSGENPGSVLKLDDLSFSGGDVSLEEFENMSLSLYPNPSRDYVMIKSNGTFDFRFIDLAGNLVLKQERLNGPQQIDVSHLSKGAYIVQINNGVQVESLRFIKE